MNGLPDISFITSAVDNKVIMIKKGERGYYNYENPMNLTSDELNESIGVNKAQAAAMSVGSMFGWEVPGAKLENYDDSGNYVNKTMTDF